MQLKYSYNFYLKLNKRYIKILLHFFCTFLSQNTCFYIIFLFWILRCCYISALVLTCFRLTKGRATFFSTRNNCCEFLVSKGVILQNDIHPSNAYCCLLRSLYLFASLFNVKFIFIWNDFFRNILTLYCHKGDDFKSILRKNTLIYS